MTAVIGLLNKYGVAIAADSAVTVSGHNNRKIYNSANKIFTLSKYHPVGIAIYNNAQLMGVPWEIIIKEYRKQLEKRSFPRLVDYKDDFFYWLKVNNYFVHNNSNNYFSIELVGFIQQRISNYFEANNNLNIEINEEIFTDILQQFITNNKKSKIDSLSDLPIGNLNNLVNAFLAEAIQFVDINYSFKINSPKCLDKLKEAFFVYFTHEYYLSQTGLIFTGYGETEIYPNVITVNVSIVIDGYLKYSLEQRKCASISDEKKSSILPFAQTDVIDTILRGISPKLSYLTTQIFNGFIVNFKDEIKNLPGLPSELKEILENININDYVMHFQQSCEQKIKEENVVPLMQTLASLSKEDLAEMSESLVYLTYLKRRFTMAEESVGGPVDVAVITKGDGFIWIKRKHYFNPDLNRNFFNNYF